VPQLITNTATTTVATWQVWNETYTTTSITGGSGLFLDEGSTTGAAGSSASTWIVWNQPYSHGATTSAVSTRVVGNVVTTTVTTADPWPTWNAQYLITSGSGGGAASAAQVTPIRQYTPEEVAAQEQRRIADRERRVRYEGERALARQRAQRLLGECLSPAQREELAARGYFTIETLDSASGERRRYRINRGRSRNVQRVDDTGRVLRPLCAHPAIDCPDEDTMLAQKLWLETRESDFLRVANHS